MAKLTFNFELSRNVTKAGVSHILLRIQDEQQSKKRINTGIDVDPKNWNQRHQRIRTSDPDYVLKNGKLQKILNDAQDAKVQLMAADASVNAESVCAVYKKDITPLSYIDYAKEYVERLYSVGNWREYRKYKTAIVKLQFFINGFDQEAYLKAPRQESDEFAAFEESSFKKDLKFEDITNGFVQKYVAYLNRMPNLTHSSQVISSTTVRKQISLLRSCFRKGLKERNIEIKSDPFYDIRVPIEEKTKAKLTREELKKLEDLPLDSHSMLSIVRDCFMFAYYCAGMRCGDLLWLRGTNLYQQDGFWRLSYTMSKTSKPKDIKLQKPALVILSRYVDFRDLNKNFIFPLMNNNAPYAVACSQAEIKLLKPEVKRMRIMDLESKNSLLNNYLRKLTELAGVQKHVTMHVTRHSFADLARSKGANLDDVRLSLGHTKLTTTQIYLSSFDVASQDRALDMIYQYESPEEKAVKDLMSLSLIDVNKVLASYGYKLIQL